MWAIVGLVLAMAGAVYGEVRSRSREPGYYESQVYEMTALSHRRFAIASIAFAGAFALVFAIPVVPVLPVLGAYVVLLVLYFSSFVRGATGDDE
jgi:hypothetical protein